MNVTIAHKNRKNRLLGAGVSDVPEGLHYRRLRGVLSQNIIGVKGVKKKTIERKCK